METGREPAAPSLQPHSRYADMMDNVAKRNGKTTIAQHDALTGGTLLWVTKDEADPVTALLHAAIAILVHRGQQDGRVKIRKLTELVVPGSEYAWQVTDPADGTIIAHGYAATESEAAERIAEHMKLTPQH